MGHRDAIAIFDSGIGGLSVLKEVVKLLPNESYIYFGDGEHCPYGEKSREEVRELTTNAIEQIVTLGVKLIVVACNTASSAAIEQLRQSYSIPFVAMEPAVKPAILSSKSGKIGVLATKRTIEGNPFKLLCQKWSEKGEIITRAGEGLVEIVEQSKENSYQSKELVKKHIEYLLEKGVDKIVLGCTHYPMLLEQIKEVIGSRDVEIINPAPFIAHRVAQILEEKGELNQHGSGKIEYKSSADQKYIEFLKYNYNKICLQK